MNITICGVMSVLCVLMAFTFMLPIIRFFKTEYESHYKLMDAKKETFQILKYYLCMAMLTSMFFGVYIILIITKGN